jgi:hypothetical protein
MSSQPSILERVLRLTRSKPKPHPTTKAVAFMDLPRELRQSILFYTLHDSDHIENGQGEHGNRYFEYFLDDRRTKHLSAWTLTLYRVHPCIKDDVAYVAGKWWEDIRKKKDGLKEEFRVWRQGYIDGSLKWDESCCEFQYRIYVFAKLVHVLEWYKLHPVRHQMSRTLLHLGCGSLWEFYTGTLPTTFLEYLDVARVFLRINSD